MSATKMIYADITRHWNLCVWISVDNGSSDRL